MPLKEPVTTRPRTTRATSARRPARGFTLIEVVVVFALVGILATFIRLAVGDGGRAARLRDAAELVAQLSAAAAEEAVFASRPVALVISDDGLALMEFRRGEWQPRANDALYRARALPPGIEIRASDAAQSQAAALNARAPALFFPDGTSDALALELRDPVTDTRALLIPTPEGYRVGAR
ncbi:MAG: type II secretion system protein [Gammaproteobacteria bacterium]